jgi:DNA transformation protein
MMWRSSGKRYVEGTAYPGAKPSMLIGASEIENKDRLRKLIRLTADALPIPKPKRAK